jgi:uncharacterized phage protein gp47/JayE
MDLPSRLDLFARGRSYIRRTAKKLDPAWVDVEGTNSNIFVAAVSIMASVVVSALAQQAAARLIESAQGTDLDRIVFDQYGFTRKGASPSRTDIEIRRATFAAGAGTVPVGTRVMAGSMEFVTVTPASFGPTDLVSQARVRSTKAGASTRTGKLTINRFSRVGDLFDKSLTCSNPQEASGGEDAEQTEVFRARAKKFARAMAKGTLDAIEYGATTVEGVTFAVAKEIVTSVIDQAFVGGYRDLPATVPARIVELFIADSTGVASRALAADVEAILPEWRAAGVAVLVRTSIPLIVPVTVRVAYAANVDTVTLQSQMKAAIVSYMDGLAPNETLYTSNLISVLKRFTSLGVIIRDDAIVVPAGDLVPDVGQTLRTLPENVVVSTV